MRPVPFCQSVFSRRSTICLGNESVIAGAVAAS
jgi:hypothetical protein